MKKTNEDGAIIVEATLYFPVVILVVGFVILVSLMKLQQCLVAATLSSASSIATMDAMDGYDVQDELDDIDSFISSFSVVKGRNQLVAVEEKGSLVKMVRVRMSYRFEAPKFYTFLLRGSAYANYSGGVGPMADVTAIAIDPREVIDTLDQELIFSYSGPNMGNLMYSKYLTNLYSYLSRQYKKF